MATFNKIGIGVETQYIGLYWIGSKYLHLYNKISMQFAYKEFSTSGTSYFWSENIETTITTLNSSGV